MNRFKHLNWIGLTLIMLQCSENGLFDQKISSDQHNLIRGRVQLSGEENQDSIYVWLDGLNLTTYTDSSGDFMLELPPSELQPGGGLSGVFKLYYFLANYKIQHSVLYLIDGKIERNKGDIDNEGSIYPEIWLTKLLDIQTETNPAKIGINYTGDVITKIYLTNMVDTVRVNSFLFPWGEPGALIIERDSEGTNEVALIKSSHAYWEMRTITEPVTWQIINKFAPGFFTPGTYLFYPFLEVVQQDIPQELLNSLGEDVYAFGMDYLNIPFKQSPGVLSVDIDNQLKSAQKVHSTKIDSFLSGNLIQNENASFKQFLD